jgi:hypothetical protein
VGVKRKQALQRFVLSGDVRSSALLVLWCLAAGLAFARTPFNGVRDLSVAAADAFAITAFMMALPACLPGSAPVPDPIKFRSNTGRRNHHHSCRTISAIRVWMGADAAGRSTRSSPSWTPAQTFKFRQVRTTLGDAVMASKLKH